MIQLTIATDGACLGNPGPGGWAYVVVDKTRITNGGEEAVLDAAYGMNSGREEATTNNRMELLACIKALEWLQASEAKRATLLTDSQYVQRGITEWIINWKKNRWIGSNKKPVKNRDLWEQLDALNNRLSINWQWVRGHDGNQLNEFADKMANEAAGFVN